MVLRGKRNCTVNLISILVLVMCPVDFRGQGPVYDNKVSESVECKGHLKARDISWAVLFNPRGLYSLRPSLIKEATLSLR